MLLLSKLAQNWPPWKEREGHLGVCLRPPQKLQNPDSESSISTWALQELEGFLGWAGSYRGSLGPTGAPWAPRPGAQALFRGLVQQRLAEVAACAAAASRLAAPTAAASVASPSAASAPSAAAAAAPHREWAATAVSVGTLALGSLGPYLWFWVPGAALGTSCYRDILRYVGPGISWALAVVW